MNDFETIRQRAIDCVMQSPAARAVDRVVVSPSWYFDEENFVHIDIVLKDSASIDGRTALFLTSDLSNLIREATRAQAMAYVRYLASEDAKDMIPEAA